MVSRDVEHPLQYGRNRHGRYTGRWTGERSWGEGLMGLRLIWHGGDGEAHAKGCACPPHPLTFLLGDGNRDRLHPFLLPAGGGLPYRSHHFIDGRQHGPLCDARVVEVVLATNDKQTHTHKATHTGPRSWPFEIVFAATLRRTSYLFVSRLATTTHTRSRKYSAVPVSRIGLAFFFSSHPKTKWQPCQKKMVSTNKY